MTLAAGELGFRARLWACGEHTTILCEGHKCPGVEKAQGGTSRTRLVPPCVGVMTSVGSGVPARVAGGSRQHVVQLVLLDRLRLGVRVDLAAAAELLEHLDDH